MASEEQPGKIHIDSDWKEEAAREKERLKDQEEKSKRPTASGAEAPDGPTNFLDLLSLLAMQASIALGGATGPGGEQIPSNPAAAKQYIELIEMLKEKTQGNLTDDESRKTNSLLYELQMHYVALMRAPTGAGQSPGSEHTEPGA